MKLHFTFAGFQRVAIEAVISGSLDLLLDFLEDVIGAARRRVVDVSATGYIQQPAHLLVNRLRAGARGQLPGDVETPLDGQRTELDDPASLHDSGEVVKVEILGAVTDSVILHLGDDIRW